MKKYGSVMFGVFTLLFFPAPLNEVLGRDGGRLTPLQVIVADVGHGDCVWIRTSYDGVRGDERCEGYDIVIDGGSSSQRVVDILSSLGLERGSTIDWLINSHAHKDHYGGLAGILDNYEVKRVVDPGFHSGAKAFGAYEESARREPGCVYYSPAIGKSAASGSQSICPDVPCELDWGDELEVRILHSDPSPPSDSANFSSIVLHLNYNRVSFLFTGDIEGKYLNDPPGRVFFVEKFLLDRYAGKNNNELKSTIIKIPHHGSETSSTTPFIESVDPREGIICAGNRHGLPNASVVKRYEDHGCRVWRTDRLDETACPGDDHIIITTDGNDYQIKYMKRDAREEGEGSEVSRLTGYY